MYACRCDLRKEAVVDAGAVPPLLRTFAMGIPELQAHLAAGPWAATEGRDPGAAFRSQGLGLHPAAGDLMDAATAAERARADPQRYLQVPTRLWDEKLSSLSAPQLSNPNVAALPVEAYKSVRTP